MVTQHVREVLRFQNFYVLPPTEQVPTHFQGAAGPEADNERSVVLALHEISVQRLPGHNLQILHFDTRSTTSGDGYGGRLAIQ